MTVYWLYDIPTWALFCVVCSVVGLFSVGGCLLLRDRFDRWLGLATDHNDMIGNFLSFTGMFFSIMLGLVAVGAWETYSTTNDIVNTEAAEVAALYRDMDYFDGDDRQRMQQRLRTYVRMVIDTEWPQQRAGITPSIGDIPLNNVADAMMAVDVTTPKSQILLAEAFKQYNAVVEARRHRLQSVGDALPGSLWLVIAVGTIFNIVITWLFVVRHRKLDVLLNLLVSLLLGSVLAFIIAMDNPYRGEISVSPQSLELVYEQVMSY
jgi:hypothetical protein